MQVHILTNDQNSKIFKSNKTLTNNNFEEQREYSGNKLNSQDNLELKIFTETINFRLNKQPKTSCNSAMKITELELRSNRFLKNQTTRITSSEKNQKKIS